MCLCILRVSSHHEFYFLFKYTLEMLPTFQAIDGILIRKMPEETDICRYKSIANIRSPKKRNKDVKQEDPLTG